MNLRKCSYSGRYTEKCLNIHCSPSSNPPLAISLLYLILADCQPSMCMLVLFEILINLRSSWEENLPLKS